MGRSPSRETRRCRATGSRKSGFWMMGREVKTESPDIEQRSSGPFFSDIEYLPAATPVVGEVVAARTKCWSPTFLRVISSCCFALVRTTSEIDSLVLRIEQ
jgi:hypothetical protein